METPPRLKTHIRIAAHLRRASAGGAFATIARRGDPDAGVIFVRVLMGERAARLYFEGRDDLGSPIWREAFDDLRPESEAEDYIAREIRRDPDLWVIDIEDREGRAFLD
jgi:hypothetical protein